MPNNKDSDQLGSVCILQLCNILFAFHDVAPLVHKRTICSPDFFLSKALFSLLRETKIRMKKKKKKKKKNI